MRCVKMALGEPDASGRRSPKPVPGSEFDVPCDEVIVALGTSPNPVLKDGATGLEFNEKARLKSIPKRAKRLSKTSMPAAMR